MIFHTEIRVVKEILNKKENTEEEA